MLKIHRLRNEVKSNRPLIHAITNPISIHACANAILAIGGRPIMAEHPKEVEEITKTAAALLLNLGNITDIRMESIRLSLKCANEKGIPVILDAVGVACSALRRNFVSDLLEIAVPTVIKGNYSEIRALYDSHYRSFGVDADSALSESDMDDICITLSRKWDAIILASGKTDIVTDGKRLAHIRNGSEQLTSVTGTGCMLGALSATYLSTDHSMNAIVAACMMLGVCGQLSQTESGSGSFMVNLMDSLNTISDENLSNLIDMEEKHLEEI